MNTSDSFDLNFILNGTSHEHDLQSVYNGNGFIGVIIELSGPTLGKASAHSV